MPPAIQFTTHTSNGQDKISRYGWVVKDSPGILQLMDKDFLQVHPAYQRDLVIDKVMKITASWSWLSLGALVVGVRNGQYWVIDGQHRLMAAKRRSDITFLPCVVFETADVKTEAQGFLDLNTSRKPISISAKHKAMVAAEDDIANYVQETLDSLSLRPVATAKAVGQFNCLGWCLRHAPENKEAFAIVLSMAAELCETDQVVVKRQMLDGLWVLHSKAERGLLNKRLADRLRAIGAKALYLGASRASAYFAQGGGKIWAQGMLSTLNKGLRLKIEVEGLESS